MNEETGAGNEIPSGEKTSDFSDLRREVAVLLRARQGDFVKQIDHVLKGTVPGYDDLPAEVFEDVRQSFRELLRLSIGYYEADGSAVENIKSIASDIGRKRANQGMLLQAVFDGFDAAETYVWGKLTEALLPGGYSPNAWIELADMRDRFTKLVRRSFRRAYVKEEAEASRRQLDELRALSNLGQVIGSTVDLEKVLGQILDVATGLMHSGSGAIMLLDSTKKYLEPVADVGLSRTWTHMDKVPVNVSLSGVAIRRNEHVMAKDDELAAFELPRAAGGRKIRSALSIPITVNEEPIGVIELYDTAARSYTDRDITMLMAFGPQAGVAIKNARSFQAERKRRRQAVIVTEVAQAVSETMDQSQLLDAIVEKTAAALGVDRCSLFFYDEGTNALAFMAGYGRSTLQSWLLHQFSVPMADLGAATARAVRERKPVVVDASEEEPSLEFRIFRGPGVESYLQVPLYVKEELIGLMSLEFTGGEATFTGDDVALAEALARQAAVAIQNRRLQEKLFEQQLAIRNAEMNEKLYRERERSEAILRADPDAVFLIDRNMKVLLVNPAGEFLTGWSQEEARGRGCHEVLYGSESSPGLCPSPGCPINRILSGEHVSYAEDNLVTRSGRRIPVSGTFAPIFGPARMIDSVAAIYRDISEQKELEQYAFMQREMDIASGIQSSLLPRGRLVAEGVNIHARQHQAKMVGGDWYDYWSYGDRVFLVIGDASGSGVGAALFATMAIGALRVEAREHSRIIEIMEHVNQGLYQSNRSESFATVFFGVLDLTTMTLSYANAGHEEPLSLGAHDKIPRPLATSQKPPLGIFKSADLEVGRRKLYAGERLVLFTDGVIDARNPRRRFFGLKRLNRFVTSNRGLPAEDFIDSLIGSVLDFCDGEPKDDITVMVCDIP
jgi:PAS domain S-box-containing protein